VALTEVKAFLQANQEHNQERDDRNLKLQVIMKLMNLIEGSSFDLKGLVDIGKQDQEQGRFTTVDLDDASTANNDCFIRKKQECNKTLKP
jgi:hypothetical protein